MPVGEEEHLYAESNKSSRPYPIRKLKSVPVGKGQYRQRSSRFRFRYDIADNEVALLYCGLRRKIRTDCTPR